MLGRLTAGALFLAGVGVVAHATNPTVAWPLKVDPTGRLLVDQNGVPFPIVGDTAWHMQVNLTPDEMDTYFADRDARGINTIIVMAMNKCDWTGADARDQVDSGVPGIFPDDYNGNKAFTDDRAWNASRVEAYWHTVDLIVEKAQEHNMLVFFAPAYLGYECSDDNEGWCRDMIAQTDADMTEWGRWIGSRYKDRRNVIWVDGGDATARNSNNPGSLDRVQALRDALYATTPALLHTSHPSNKDMGADVYPWIDVYELYNEKNYPTGWSLVAPRANYLYSKLGPDGRHHPIFQIEGIYETQQDSGPKVWAAQFMYVALGGGIGGIYGNSYVNRFWLTTNHPCDWSGSCGLASPGSLQQANLGRLYRSRAWWRLVPDYDHTVVTQGYGTFQSPVWPFRNALGESDYVAVARTDDGESVMTWHPLASAITMDLSKISGTSATCWWYSPPDGSATPIGTFPTSGTQSFTPPDVNRVLVCDDAAKALPAPGAAIYPFTPAASLPMASGMRLSTCLAPPAYDTLDLHNPCDPSAGECRCTDLSWDPVPGATRYEVERRTVGTAIRVYAGTVSGRTVWSPARDDIFSSEGTLYRYLVRACDATGCGAWARAPINRAWPYACFEDGVEVPCYLDAPLRTAHK